MKRDLIHPAVPALACALLSASPALGVTIFTEDFESWDGVTDAVGGGADGVFTATTWPGAAFTLSGAANLMRPSATSAWLSPLPLAPEPELDSTFAVLHSGVTATADLGNVFVDNTEYTLSFTHFRRDDLTGEAVTAQIMTTGGTVLASIPFGAVPTTDTYETRSVVFATGGGPEVGENIRIRLFDGDAGNTIFFQAGIDNITLDATPIPEPTRAALLGIGGLVLLTRRRRC